MSLITATDVTTALNPSGVSNKFDLTAKSSDFQTQIVDAANNYVKAFMDERQRRMLSVIPGLVLLEYADGGETTFTIPTVARNATTVRVWANLKYQWRDRLKQAQVAFTLGAIEEEQDAAIILTTAASARDKIVAEIIHDGSNPPSLLKQFALDKAINDCVFSFPTLQLDPMLKSMYVDKFTQSREDMEKLARGQLRIPEFADLQLIDENETSQPMGWGNIGVSWGRCQ